MMELKTEHNKLLTTLKERFDKNMHRHKHIKWDDVYNKLIVNIDKLKALHEMEKTGGEPDVVGFDINTKEFNFYDCSSESPIGRRSVCYDREAQESRKEHKPKNNALDMANAIGIEILTEKEYRELQRLGEFDTKTSSWIKTPTEIRKLGGAIFADKRYNEIFVYHNGAQSYYAGRGFRGVLRV